jgi:hypothetical protein
MKKLINKEKLMFYKNEGVAIPRFYLPVKYVLTTGQLECWFFLLAPFSWLCYVIKNIAMSIIRDTLEWIKLLEQKRKGFKNINNKTLK